MFSRSPLLKFNRGVNPRSAYHHFPPSSRNQDLEECFGLGRVSAQVVGSKPEICVSSPPFLRRWDLGKSEEICGKYERIPSMVQNLGLGKIPSSPPLFRLYDLKIFRASPLYLAGTWKNSELSPYIGSGPLYSLWDLGKFRKKPTSKIQKK